MTVLRTPLQIEREKRDMAVYSDYAKMAAVPGQSKTEVVKFIAQKYGFHATCTVYTTIKRVKARLEKQTV